MCSIYTTFTCPYLPGLVFTGLQEGSHCKLGILPGMGEFFSHTKLRYSSFEVHTQFVAASLGSELSTATPGPQQLVLCFELLPYEKRAVRRPFPHPTQRPSLQVLGAVRAEDLQGGPEELTSSLPVMPHCKCCCCHAVGGRAGLQRAAGLAWFRPDQEGSTGWLIKDCILRLVASQNK